MKRIAVFIDGANIYATAKMLRVDIDYKRLQQSFGPELVRCYYYTATKPRTPELQDTIVPLLDWLSYNGFKLVSKSTKTYEMEGGGTRMKGNMDIEIAVDMLEAAKSVTDMWLFSGDGDFKYVVEAVQRAGVRVTVCSSIKTSLSSGASSPCCSDELRRAADAFVELADIKQFHRETGMRSTYA